MRALVAAIAALALAGPAAAGQIVVHLSFVPGKLAISAPVTRIAPTGTALIQVTVADGRGSGAGWQLTSVSSGRLSVTSITATCAAGSTCTLPKAATAPSGTTILRAAKGTGMGVMRLRVFVKGTPGSAVKLAVR